MRRLAALSFVLAAGLAVSACGHTTVAAHDRVPVMPTPLVSTAPTTSPATAVAVAWTPEVAGQIQAAQLEAAEEQYAACFAYAGLDQSLAGVSLRPDMPVVVSCSTAGLTPAEVQEIQNLILQAS